MNPGRLCQIIIKSDKEISGYGHAVSATCDFRISHGTANSAHCTFPAALPWSQVQVQFYFISVEGYKHPIQISIKSINLQKKLIVCCQAKTLEAQTILRFTVPKKCRKTTHILG